MKYIIMEFTPKLDLVKINLHNLRHEDMRFKFLRALVAASRGWLIWVDVLPLMILDSFGISIDEVMEQILDRDYEGGR